MESIMPPRLRFVRILSYFLIGALQVSAAFAVDPFFRVLYSDDPALKLDQRLVQEAYGARFIVLPAEGKAPANPSRYAGIVFHTDDADFDWAKGTRNPQMDFAALEGEICRQFPFVHDINDKWDEYLFLNRTAPGISEPETHLASEFVSAALQGAQDPQLDALAAKVAGEIGIHDPAVLKQLVLVEKVRVLAQGKLGKGIVKLRQSFHSEGRLPRTHKDWMTLFANYLVKTKPQVEKLESSLTGTTSSIEDEIVSLPYIEGRILEAMLAHPETVIIQKMVEIQKEIRVHVVEGAILEGATFLRMNPLGAYLTPDEIERVESEVRTSFLARLPASLSRFSCTCDVVLMKGARQPSIIDLNAGLASGYYFPEDDIYTTNLLAAHYTKHSTPLLQQFDEIRHTAPGRSRAERVHELHEKFDFFLDDDNQGGFWERVMRFERDELAHDPTPAHFDAALTELAGAGLKHPWLLYEFIEEVQDTWATARLSPDRLEYWRRTIDAMDRHFRGVVRGGRLDPQEVAAEASAD
jgi:hypothetical protein